MESEIVDYPIFKDPALTVNEGYKEVQKKGLIRIKLPYGEPCWLATRYADARAVLGDHRFSRKAGLSRDAPGLMPSALVKDPALLLNQDPPEHSRMRRLAAGPFTRAYVKELESWAQGVVDELLDDMAAAGPPADFVAMFSSKLSFRVLTGILGIPRDKGGEFRKWVELVSALDSDEQTRRNAAQRTDEFIKSLVAERRVRHGDDLIGALVDARDEGDRLSEEELISLVMQFWVGGFKTTHWQLGSMAYALMTHRERWRELVDDPALVPAALEELWRWIPSFRYGFIFVRWATEDVAFSDGTVVRAGEAVLPETSVANRDESVYPHGWEIDFHRADPAPHLAFTYGAHACIGQHLARLQVRLTVEALLRRFPELALAVPEEKLKWSPSTMLRSLEALPLKW